MKYIFINKYVLKYFFLNNDNIYNLFNINNESQIYINGIFNDEDLKILS